MQLTEADLAAWPRRRRAALVNSLSGFKSANLLGTRSAGGQETWRSSVPCSIWAPTRRWPA